MQEHEARSAKRWVLVLTSVASFMVALDALVVGRSSDRFGEEVVALVQLRPGTALTGADIREYAAQTVARFKAPRAVLLCDRIARHPSGKADYGWARGVAVDAVAVAG